MRILTFQGGLSDATHNLSRAFIGCSRVDMTCRTPASFTFNLGRMIAIFIMVLWPCASVVELFHATGLFLYCLMVLEGIEMFRVTSALL